MAVETVGNPPAEADQLKAEIEKKLPDIMARFSQVLKEEFGVEGIRVGGFSLVPVAETTQGVSCDDEGCSVTE